MEKLYIYVRVSTEKQAEKGYSIQSQIEEGEKVANQYGLEPKILNEGAHSANYGNVKMGPKMEELISLVKKGEIKHLFILEGTRLARELVATLNVLCSMKKHNVIYYTKDGKRDLNNFEDMFQAQLAGILAELDNSRRGYKITMGIKQAALRGKWIGANYPFGYGKDKDKKIIIDIEESKVIKKIYDLSLKGIGSNSIADILNKEGIQTRVNKIGDRKSVV